MNSAWHRLGQWLEIREDPAETARKEVQRGKPWAVRLSAWVLEVSIAVLVAVAFFSVLALIVHLVSGDATPGGVLVDGLRFFGVALGVAAVAFFVGRWLYWFADLRTGRS